MQRRFACTCLFVAVCFLFASLGAYGQTLGSIAGEVHDTSGAVVPGAAISATNTSTNATRTSVTNEAGEYAFRSLPPGIYSLKAEKAGFKTTVRPQGLVQVRTTALNGIVNALKRSFLLCSNQNLSLCRDRLNPHRRSLAMHMIQFTEKNHAFQPPDGS